MKMKNIYKRYMLLLAMMSLLLSSSFAFAQEHCNNTEPTPGGSGNNALATPTSNSTVDSNGIGLGTACKGLDSQVDSFLAINHPKFVASGMINDNFQNIYASFKEYQKHRQGCLNGHASAATMCMEGTSPQLANGAAQVNNILSAMGAASSMNDSCSKTSKGMQLAKAALTAYTGACGASRALCNSSCVKANNGVNKFKEAAVKSQQSATCSNANPATSVQCQANVMAYKNALAQAIQLADQETNKDTKESIAGKAKLCSESYARLIGSALGGILSAMASMKQADGCEEQTDGTQAQMTSVTCALPENVNRAECICINNPRTEGCSNAYQKVGQNSGEGQFGVGLLDKGNVNPSDDISILDGDGSGIQQAELNKSDGSGGIGPPTGGGAGLGSSKVGNGLGQSDQGAGGAKGLNTNIFAGAGGGGGGMRGGVGGSADNKYRSYLPGGANDPTRTIAGQETWAKEVTGQGGKSNFEKVKDRYQDNKGTLLNK